MVKIIRLTPSNLSALVGIDIRDDVHLGHTTATFDMTAAEALRLVEQYQSDLGAEYGTTGHPYKSLHAVIRKLRNEVPHS
jgi:hypothetical protein